MQVVSQTNVKIALKCSIFDICIIQCKIIKDFADAPVFSISVDSVGLDCTAWLCLESVYESSSLRQVQTARMRIFTTDHFIV